MKRFPVLVMLAPSGASSAERWMAAAQKSAALDLCRRLGDISGLDLLVVAPSEDTPAFEQLGAASVPGVAGEFHFGSRLAELVASKGWKRLACFGAASAPLLSASVLSSLFDRTRELPQRSGLVNNLHSTDWMLLNDTSGLQAVADRLPKDNMAGWVLSREGGYQIESMPAETMYRADLDTPADVAFVARHPGAGAELRAAASTLDDSLQRRVAALEDALSAAGNSLAIIGRASSTVWGRLEAERSIWVRAFVEERGMVASGRLAAGAVRSLIGEAVNTWGPRHTLDLLAEAVQGVLWDTRVWMAHRRAWPSDADRLASDLGRVGEIRDAQLRALTEAILDSPIPIVTGGQGVVGGALMAWLDVLKLERSEDYQPSR